MSQKEGMRVVKGIVFLFLFIRLLEDLLLRLPCHLDRKTGIPSQSPLPLEVLTTILPTFDQDTTTIETLGNLELDFQVFLKDS
jgi:hypothetical protein